MIDILHRWDLDVFDNAYFARSRPVVLKGLEGWPALGKWSPSYFLGEFGTRRSG